VLELGTADINQGLIIKYKVKSVLTWIFYLKAVTLYPGEIRSHLTTLQSPWWQAETIPRRQGLTWIFCVVMKHTQLKITCIQINVNCSDNVFSS
jgi:hypothetical protein